MWILQKQNLTTYYGIPRYFSNTAIIHVLQSQNQSQNQMKNIRNIPAIYNRYDI